METRENDFERRDRGEEGGAEGLRAEAADGDGGKSEGEQGPWRAVVALVVSHPLRPS